MLPLCLDFFWFFIKIQVNVEKTRPYIRNTNDIICTFSDTAIKKKNPSPPPVLHILRNLEVSIEHHWYNRSVCVSHQSVKSLPA